MQSYKVKASNGYEYTFICSAPLQAMQNMLYYLNGFNNKEQILINKTESGEHLYFDYKGVMYSIENNIFH